MAIHKSVHTYAVKRNEKGYSVTNIQTGQRYMEGKHFGSSNPQVTAVLYVAQRDTSYTFFDDDVKFLGSVGDKDIYLVSV